MGTLQLKQTLTIQAYKKPAQAGVAITQFDFKIDPPDNLSADDYNESHGSRYSIPDATVDQSMSMGTVALGKVLVFQPDHDIKVKVVNAEGESQDIKLKAGRASVLHMEFTGLKLSNDSGAAATGRFFLMGD